MTQGWSATTRITRLQMIYCIETSELLKEPIWWLLFTRGDLYKSVTLILCIEIGYFTRCTQKSNYVKKNIEVSWTSDVQMCKTFACTHRERERERRALVFTSNTSNFNSSQLELKNLQLPFSSWLRSSPGFQVGWINYISKTITNNFFGGPCLVKVINSGHRTWPFFSDEGSLNPEMLFSNALRLGLVFAFLSAACAFMMGGVSLFSKFHF